MATGSNIEMLSEECVSTILSYTSPPDACRFSLVSSTFQSAANSDLVWHKFLPSDYEDIVSTALKPLTFSTKKDLFYALCRPLLIDGGNKSFQLDKFSSKKSYVLSARELLITWSNDPMLWSWRSMPESRFPVVAVLRTVSWLEIIGKIRTGILTRDTLYGAYLIIKLSHRAYGLESAASEISVEVGNRVQSGRAYLCLKDENRHKTGNTVNQGVPSKRNDGWMEIELGEFFSGESDEEVKMSLTEADYHLKGGLIIEGIEVRPK
ncbi:hypothetical protein L6164_010472 [Bauhinia variegata]|uniref:Uncharacterized protein n=1 Tax=Bauhinia variegata TaxID=167791 RepID=A0ACB9PN75_BAUVA|nr:hypothetical protein L6164_010472 [Bauhinia variegata]